VAEAVKLTAAKWFGEDFEMTGRPDQAVPGVVHFCVRDVLFTFYSDADIGRPDLRIGFKGFTFEAWPRNCDLVKGSG
jgi:hypothetical protein